MTADFDQAARRVRRDFGDEPFDLAVVLGSGLGNLTQSLTTPLSLAYAEIPGFRPTRVAGHGGRLWSGLLGGWRVLVFEGRFHVYEGYSAAQAACPVPLAAALGCRRLLLTNAAGGVRDDLRPGDFMFISDHLNLLGDNPLRGVTDQPFVDLSHLYRTDLFPALRAQAAALGCELREGVLAALCGPSYETPAEIRMIARLGGDAVSMSTVPEAILARYLGFEVAGLSLIANRAAGLHQGRLTHEEVLAEGRRGAALLGDLAAALIRCWQAAPPLAAS
ncbi:purine-nucleoside phosphorylase [Geoalkalibacter sp.]|uniref:purine-nucleoside phosphorylase n=1 Tax=Geoalkalibacter sp. TaxID=3041440 RepID=UPI00272E6A24|nr:purine-nucleoside phosphorylase [Geoalkalibacter sp.]